MNNDSLPSDEQSSENQIKIYLKWVAPAYRQTEKSKAWYLLMGLVVLGFVLYGLFSGDATGWIISITFLVLAGVYYLSELKQVPIVQISISKLGIQFGQKYYPYNQIKSFWILNEPNAKHLNLILQKGMDRSLSIIMPDDINIGQLREFLLLQIPEEEGKEESFVDQLIRNLGL